MVDTQTKTDWHGDEDRPAWNNPAPTRHAQPHHHYTLKCEERLWDGMWGAGRAARLTVESAPFIAVGGLIVERGGRVQDYGFGVR